MMMRPVLRHTDAGVVEIGWRCRRYGKRKPKRKQNRNRGRVVNPPRGQRNQKDKKVTEADLCQRILEGEIRVVITHGSQYDPKQDQHQGAPSRVHQQSCCGAASLDPADDRKRHRGANQKSKARLNQIVQRATFPSDMRGVKAKPLEKTDARKGLGQSRQMHDLGQHQEHHHPAVNVDATLARRRIAGHISFRFTRHSIFSKLGLRHSSLRHANDQRRQQRLIV